MSAIWPYVEPRRASTEERRYLAAYITAELHGLALERLAALERGDVELANAALVVATMLAERVAFHAFPPALPA